jgi:N-hydroxyarylamine O-acetyltransferase
MDLEPYFQRIGFSGTADNSLATLKAIHRLHPQAIAFENLSSFLAREVSLQPANVFNKLVVQGRGGYCFEQNLVLALVLKQLGFEVSEHAARVVWRSPNKTLMARTHMLLKVLVDGDAYIADVGFGGLTMTAPLLLEPELVQHSSHEDFKISQDEESETSKQEYTISVRLKNEWKAMYIFDLVPQYPVDFEMANYFIATHPQSLFIINLVLGRADSGCRHALQNTTYTKYSTDGAKDEREIENADALIELLTDTFQVNLSGTVDEGVLRERFEKLV